MNRGTLPILARLQSLQSAARVAPGGARVIAAIADPSPLTALLCEVNETMLGRSLCFESSGGSSLTLEVSGRRVLRVTGANGLVGAERCLASPALEDEQKDDLIKLLQAVAAPRHELRVTATAVGREGEGVSIGLPVALLADLLLIDLNGIFTDEPAAAEPVFRPMPMVEPDLESEPEVQPDSYPEPEPEPEPEFEPEEAEADPDQQPEDDVPLVALPDGGTGPLLGRFARGMGPGLMAWLIAGGAEDGTTDGPEEMVTHLLGFLDDEGEALSLQLDLIAATPDEPICIVLGATLAEGHSILCARADGGYLLGVIEGDGTRTMLRAWTAALS